VPSIGAANNKTARKGPKEVELKRIMLVVAAWAIVGGAVAHGSLVTPGDVTLGHSWQWGWTDNGEYSGDSVVDNIDFWGVKVVSGKAFEGPAPVSILKLDDTPQTDWTSWLNADGTAGAAGPDLTAALGWFKIHFTQVDDPDTTIIRLAAFSGGTLIGATETTYTIYNSDAWTWVYKPSSNIYTWNPAQSDFVQSTSVPEPATLIIWSLLGGLGIAVGWSRRKRAA
jgi:hypothetical protein